MPAASRTSNDSAVRRPTSSEPAQLVHERAHVGEHRVDAALGRHRRLRLVEDAQHAVDAVGDEAGGVERAHLLRQPARPDRAVRARRPRGSRCRSSRRRRSGGCGPCATIASTSRSHHSGEVERRVEVGLALGPHVGQLVHDEDAVPVAGVEHRPADRVVRAADRVEARGLQQLDPALIGAVDGDRAEHAVVGVDARAAEQDRLAVDPQPTLGVERQRADAEGHRRRRRPRSSPSRRVTDRRVERRRVRAPQRRVADEQPLPDDGRLAGQHGHRRRRRWRRRAPSPSRTSVTSVERRPAPGRRSRPSSRPRRRRTRRRRPSS